MTDNIYIVRSQDSFMPEIQRFNTFREALNFIAEINKGITERNYKIVECPTKQLTREVYNTKPKNFWRLL